MTMPPGMTRVRIAALKSRLSEHLRAVKRGATIEILERETPIARIVPLTPHRSLLTSRSPSARAAPLGTIRLPPPLKVETDIVELLAEERGDR